MKQTWKIGELARETGLTVRTLHHYDEIGLLVPSQRAENGYRLYSNSDVARLQQIVSLKELGFSLEQIKKLLNEKEYSSLEIVNMHVEQLNEKIAWEQRLCRQLERVAEALESRTDVTTQELIRIVEVISLMDKHNFDPKFTAEEQAKIEAQGQKLGEDAIRDVEREWPELIAKVRAHMDKGTPPSDPQVQALAERWRELVLMFTGGDPEIGRKLKEAYDSSPEFTAEMGMDPALFQYVEEAMGKSM